MSFDLGAQIFIPTKDRVASLRSVLEYLFHFYPSVPRIYIADGSDPVNQAALREYLRELGRDVVHLEFAPSCPFFERITQGLREVESSTVIMNADDDFPFLDQLQLCDALLIESSDAVSVMGGTVNFMFERSGSVSSFVNATRTIDAPDPFERCESFSIWPYSTTYSVTRRPHLLERYAWCQKAPQAGYFDFAIGIHDLLAGPIIALPTLTHIATRNYSQAYWRKDSDLAFRNHLAAVRSVAENLSAAIALHSDLSAPQAYTWCLRLVKERFLEHLGASATKQPGFWLSKEGRNQGAQAQIDLFRQLVTHDSVLRSSQRSKIEYIRQAVCSTIAPGLTESVPDYFDLV